MYKPFFAFIFCLLSVAAFAQTTAPALTAAPATSPLNEFAGIYVFDNTFTSVIVVIKEGNLWAEVDQFGQNKLLPTDNSDKFQSTSSYGTVFTFLRDDDKKVVKVRLELMGQEIVGIKKKE
jgi:hypothetical protein